MLEANEVLSDLCLGPHGNLYLEAAERRKKAAKEVAKLAKKDKTITPVEITGRKIAASFWGKAWCDHLESYSDYENRLPRGRTYVRKHCGWRSGTRRQRSEWHFRYRNRRGAQTGSGPQTESGGEEGGPEKSAREKGRGKKTPRKKSAPKATGKPRTTT